MNSLEEEWNLASTNENDSNALVILGKKNRNTPKLKNQKKAPPPLSKSQKRKLKKLEEEKAKEALLSESIQNLQKYQIQDDVHSLLKSSGSIGQAETRREKLERAEKFSKVGMVEPPEEKLSKRRRKEIDPPETQSVVDEGPVKDNDPRSVLEDLDNDCSLETNQEMTCVDVEDKESESDSDMRCNEFSNVGNIQSTEDDHRNPFLTQDTHESLVNSQLEDMEVGCPRVECNNSSNDVEDKMKTAPVASVVVHVSRPEDIEEKRKDLPIVMMEQEIMEAINESHTVIICGETGCGKTTQVPQFLYEAGFGSSKTNGRNGIVGVTQPRRVAVLATAKRVAFELGFRLGREVGFQVRHDRRLGDSASIKFMTDGILLRELQSDILLKRYSVIILDEAHERSLNTDILIGMLSRTIQFRKSLCQEQLEQVKSGVYISPENTIYPLKLVIMSATLRVEDFVSQRKLFAEPPPVIKVPARQFPVTLYFSKKTEIVDYMGQAFKKVMSIHKKLPPGGILVFATGQREVEDLCKKLRRASKELTSIKTNRERENKIAVALETNTTEQETDLKDISEAFESNNHSTDQQHVRFSACEENSGDPDTDESFTSDDDSGEESEWTIDGDDDTECSNCNSLEDVGNLADVLGEAGSLSTLKAAFDALSGKNTPNTGSKVLDLSDTPAIDGCLKSDFTILDTCKGPIATSAGGLHVLPLYAMLPAAAQLQVFDEVKEGDRLIVVATNVAETSLTIPGIKYVVDTGREKVKNYNSTNGMETYEVQWISKASAAQRAGRAGRTGPGHCYRLYSTAVFSNVFSDFSSAEISKIPVDGVVLLLKSMHIDKVANFPFPTSPGPAALLEAERCLKHLEALDERGRLSPLGKAMAHYPMSPRHSRMLLTSILIMRNVKGYKRANLVFGYAVAAAAALSVSNPFNMQFGGSKGDKDNLGDEERNEEEKLKQKKLKQVGKVARERFRNASSDALSIAYGLQLFELAENPVEFCNENALHLKTMEEMSKLRKQLLRLVFHQKLIDDLVQDFVWTHGSLEDVEQAWRVSFEKHPLLMHEEELLGQAICAGWVDRVAKRNRVVSGLSDGDRKSSAVRYEACSVQETVYLHRFSSVARTSPEFLVYTELLQTKLPYMHGVTSVKADWLVKYGGSLCVFTSVDDPKPYYEPTTDQVMSWAIPFFGKHRWELPLYSLPIKSDRRVDVFCYALLEGQVLPCLKSAQKYLAAPPVSILKPESLSQPRVGNLIKMLNRKSKKIDSRAKLKELWAENPQELHSEILDWFQKKYHNLFEEVWQQMHREVQLDHKELYPKSVKKEKKKMKQFC